MLSLIPAELTKLRSTASVYWTSGIIVGLSLLFAFIFAGPGGGALYFPFMTVSMVGTIASIVTVVQAAMIVTTEYRFGVQTTNFRLAPKRWTVALVKLLVGAVLAAIVVAISLVAAFALADVLSENSSGWLSDPVTTRALWAMPLGFALLVMFTQGLGWIVRNTAGTVTLVLAIEFVAEAAVGMIPRVGQQIADYMPFRNLFAFMFDAPLRSHDAVAALGVFAAWAVVLWLVGVVLVHQRDA